MAARESQIEEVVLMGDDKEKNEEAALMDGDHEPSEPKVIDFINKDKSIARRSDRCKKFSVYVIFILTVIGDKIGTAYDLSHSKYKVIASVVVLTLGWLYSLILVGLHRSDEVYRVRVYTQPMPKTQAITIPYKVVHYPTVPCGSISEFCATRGSPYYMILLVMCTIISWLLLGMTRTDGSYISYGPYTAENNLFIAGCLGVFTIGIWELHPEDIVHVVFHYVGTIGLLCFSLAYCVQCNWNVTSIILLSCGVFFWIFWIILKAVRCEPFVVKESDDPKVVKRSSVILIMVEMVFIAFFFVAGVAFILNLDQRSV
eukprot:981694_1